MTVSQERRMLALRLLLSQPDPPDLRTPDGACRAYHYTYPRDSRRDPDVIKRDFGTAYVAWRRQEHKEGDISCVVSVRRMPKMKIVRRA